MVYTILGEHAEAQRCLDTALKYAIVDGNDRAQAATLFHLGQLEMTRGNPAGAVSLYQRCLDVARRIDDFSGQSWANCRLGEALRLLDQHDPALLVLFQAQYFAQRNQDPSAYASSLATAGLVYHAQDNHPAAIAHAERALAIAESIPDLEIVVQVCISLAEITSTRSDTATARKYAHRAVEVCQRTNNVSAEARSREILGDVSFIAGETSDAVLAWQLAEDLYARTGNTARATAIRAKLAQAPAEGADVPTARSEPAPPKFADHRGDDYPLST
jgi:tetratricopeptide (TPR) repeat protein